MTPHLFYRALLGTLLVCGTLAMPSLSASGPSTDLAAIQAKATRLYRDGRLEEALPLYQRLASLRPDDIVVLKNLMWVLWKTGDAVGTVAVASRVASRVPEDIETWNLLAQAAEAANRPEVAIRAYRKQLALEPERDDIRLALARLYLNVKDIQTAIMHLERVAKRKPDSVDAFAALAQIYFYKNAYESSLQNWRKALAVKPDNPNYLFGEAKTLYYAGNPEAAVARMKSLLAAHPDHREAADFLTDDALANGDLATARTLLISRLTEFRQEDELRILQLTDVLQSRGEWEQSIAVLKRYLNVNATNGQALLRMGDALNQVHRSTEAVAYYEKVTEKNPSSVRALVGLADTYITLSRPHRAVEIFRRAMQLDPTNPTLLIRYGQYLHDAQDYDASRKVLTEWVSQQVNPALPVLLYHGLTPYPRDPLLAYSVHMSTSVFEDQMKALREAGYQPVTVQEVNAWYHQNGLLPKKPILITFDDARVDSFQYADPILEKYGLRATMFAHTANVDENLPGHASWDELKRYHQTPRWEIQSHGDEGHNKIQIDAEGRQGIFLANKIWMPRENRFETLREWRDRIDADHKRGIRKIKDSLGVTPVALSWPEGNFGQDSVPNSPEAAAINQEIVRKYFGLAFQQDEFGLNLRSRDPYLLSRMQPSQRMSGKALVRFLNDHHPVTRAHRILLQHAVWENRIAEAERWHQALKDDGVDASVLRMEEARLINAGGQSEKAVKLAQEAVQLNDSAESRQFLAEMLSQKRRGWTAGTLFQKDNQDRENLMFEQSLDVAKTGPIRWSLSQHYRRLLEKGTPSVTDLGAGLALFCTPQPHHQLQLRSAWHGYSAPLKDEFSLESRWYAQWTPSWSSQLEGARVPYDNAKAVRAGVVDRFARAGIQWQDPGTWRIGLSGAGHDLSDTNGRYSASAEMARRIGWKPLQVLARAAFDRTERISPNYYSPQDFQVYQGGVEIFHSWRQSANVRARYLPGMGKEKGTKWDFSQEGIISVSIPVWRLICQPSYSLYMTPRYKSHNYFLGLELPF